MVVSIRVVGRSENPRGVLVPIIRDFVVILLVISIRLSSRRMRLGTNAGAAILSCLEKPASCKFPDKKSCALVWSSLITT